MDCITVLLHYSVILPNAGSQDAEVRILDSQGWVLVQQRVVAGLSSDQEINLNISSLPVGTYFLQYVRGEESRVLRFIKE